MEFDHLQWDLLLVRWQTSGVLQKNGDQGVTRSATEGWSVVEIREIHVLSTMCYPKCGRSHSILTTHTQSTWWSAVDPVKVTSVSLAIVHVPSSLVEEIGSLSGALLSGRYHYLARCTRIPQPQITIGELSMSDVYTDNMGRNATESQR